MKNTIHMIAAVALLFLASKVYSQAPAAPFSLKLDVSPGDAKAGSKIGMEVDLTNTTKKEVAIEICHGMSVECNFAIHVRDSNGNCVSATPYLTQPQFASTGGMGIAPGETKTFYSELSRLFDLSRPGTYTVQVSRSGRNMYINSDNSQVVVESDPVTFTVAPNPQFLPSPPYMLVLFLTPHRAQAGSSFVAELLLKNYTGKRIGLQVCGGLTLECNFDIDVRDSRGNPAPEMPYLEAINRSGGAPHRVALQGIGGISAEPGETLTFKSDLSKLYDLSRPGMYTIRVRRTDIGQAVADTAPGWFEVTPNTKAPAPPETCTGSAEVIVDVSDTSGANVANALVVFRPEGAGADEAQVRVLKTMANGTARASLPCGAADLFVAANKFTPYTRKVRIGDPQTSFSVVLQP
jgi:hypothetical protein